ncbi:chemotaxis protein CheW [bacterium]|nr:chemotaxis protein CheW [bacterium]
MSTKAEFVTFRIGGQIFGAAVADIQDVFRPHSIAPVPRAQREIAGLLNLRGRIVTAIDARTRLGLADRPADAPAPLAIGFERDGETYGLVIDEIGDVISLDVGALEHNPVNLDPIWASVSLGVHRLDDTLLVIMDIDKMLGLVGVDASQAA